jgi:hypothetical protein
MIVDGHKTLESRNSDTLRPYVGKRVAIVRTGEGKAKAIGEVTVGEPRVVNQKQFRAMEDEHKVPKGSRFDINTPTKHLYPMHDPVRYEEERDVGHGIVSRKVIHKARGGAVEDDYRSEHQAPSPDFGAPMHDVTRDMYPKDFYSPNGLRYYADHTDPNDRDAYNKVTRVKGKPNEMVSIHRAIPTKVYNEALKKDSPLKHMIRKGDWVAINKDYAKDHGEAVLLGDYKIASMRVPAKHVWTNADSIHEWGYHPDEKASGGIIHKAGGGSVEPTVDEMRQALAKKGSKDDYFSVLEERDMSNPRYREHLEKQQGLEGSYPETFAAPIARGLSSAAKTAKAIFAPEKQTGQIMRNPIGWGIRVPNKRRFDEPYTYTLPPPAPYVPRAPEEIANQALKRLPERFKDAVIDKAPTHSALSANDLMELARMYKEKEKPQNKAKGGSVVKEPKSTVKAYKLFRVHKDHPGKLFPLFVDANTPVEMNKWVDAKEGEMKGNKVKSKIGDLAYRPGWHAGDLPIATHIGEKSHPSKTAPDRRPSNHAWAEVEMPDDVDWQSEATKRGTNAQGKLVPVKAHITDQIPKGGHYRYKTNPNMTGNWLIGGSMKVNKVLSDAEVERINKKAGMADLPRTEPFAKKTFGFAQGGMVNGCIAPEEFKAEEYVNYKSKGGDVKNTFDYEDADHVESVAKIASKHRDFNKIPDVVKHLSNALSQGSYKFIEDPRIQSAIKQAGHNGYYINGKDGKQQIIRKAEGGAVLPIEIIKAQMVDRFKGLGQLQSIGANEAPSLGVKAYVPTAGSPDANRMPVGGIDTSQGDLPVGGVDMSKQQAGHQLMPQGMDQPPQAGMEQGMGQMPAGDKMPMLGGMPEEPSNDLNKGASNILSMTPQGQAMSAMKPQSLAKGGSAKSVADMKAELAAKKSINDGTSTRIKIDAEGPGGVKGIVVPRHMWEGKTYKGEGGKKVEGMRDVNEARAKVYGSENRDPMSSGQMNSLHKKVLAEHFQKPVEEQTKAEEEALNRLREAKHIGKTANTLDKSEKLDTVNHETDSAGRNYVGFASKGVAGHSLYTSGHGENQKHHVINTCAGQTVGCGGGTDKNGIVDTSRGTCFAPNAESQYVNAAVRRASHEQAKHDPAMSKDWILAHTGSLRNAAENADKKNKVLLFRPNVVDETDVTSRHAIRHLNDQRKATGKPNIEANSYGKTNELHDPENGYHVTHSNVGPKVKKGASIEENISRDKARVRNTILAADNKGDFKNEQGNKTPPKGSYMVTDVKRGSEMSKNMEKHIDHAKYWSTGRPKSELTPEEISQGEEGHYGGDHKPTTEDKAHYGHKTVKGLRFDYQKQHILHPRLVQVGFNEDGSKHMIPTDSRFKDTEFLPKNRFKSKNGKDAGHILMTTPTESTSSIGHQTSFTHHVNESHIEHAKKNKGEYEIDKPEDQIKAAGKEYVAPQAVKFYAEGGTVGGRHIGFSDDDFHAFPEQNVVAQRHLAMRGHDKEPITKHSLSDHKRKVTMNKDMDTMLLELTRNKKAK